MLIEAQSGIVRTIRVTALQPAVATRLVDLIQAQAAQAFDAREYDLALNAVYARYSSEDLASAVKNGHEIAL